MMLSPRTARSPLLYVLLAATALITFYYYRNSLPTSSSLSSWASLNGVQASNATLGFGAIFVVSGPGSPRRPKLLQAANVTQLELRIPEQPSWTDEDVLKFRVDDKSQSKILTGSVKAWLSHHVVLRAFLASGLESALIFEDDVDWDVRLRSQQVPLAQKASRSLAETHNLDKQEYPWGVPDVDWEMIYLGHCGDYFNDVYDGVGIGHVHPKDLARIPHQLYPDSSLSRFTNLHPFTASLLAAFDVPQQTRMFHKSVFPLCTFGYAITRRTAQRLLTDIAPPRENLKDDIIAFDAALLHGCHNFLDKCWTIQPELFHHMAGASLIAEGSKESVVGIPPVDATGLAQLKWRKETSNIDCGFFSGEFYYGSDLQRLSFLQDEVGRKGRCLKPGRDELEK